MYGGQARFSYSMMPLNAPGVTPTARFDAAYDKVDLTQFTDTLKLDGIKLAGRLSGQNLLEWPLRRFSDHTGKGELHITPPEGVTLMTREMPLERIRAVEQRGRAGRAVQPADRRSSRCRPAVTSSTRFGPRPGRDRAESMGDGVDARRVRGADGVRRRIADPVPRLERRLAGERSRVCRTAHRVRRRGRARFRSAGTARSTAS